MSYNYVHYPSNSWMMNKYIENPELIQHPSFLPIPTNAAHPYIYYNAQQHGLNQLLLRHSSLAQVHRNGYGGGSNSTTSSPVSMMSNDDSVDSLVLPSGVPLTTHEKLYHPVSTKPFHSLYRHRSNSLSDSIQSRQHPLSQSWSATSDQPIDLTKPKSPNLLQSENKGVQSNSRLASLLSRKRKDNSDNVNIYHQQSDPLNLSKKLRTVSGISAVSGIRHHLDMRRHNCDAVIDMHDAIDNPVELVQLYQSPQTTRKISECLNEVMCKLFTLRQYVELVEADKVLLALDCWHRLLLWVYADQKFSFKVTYLPESSPHEATTKDTKSNRINQPSMAFVKSISTFLKKYESLEIDSEELKLLFAITLFHSESPNSEEPAKIVHHRKHFTQQLHSYVMSKPGGGAKRYTDLLLYLPMLYGVNGRMVETLFCRHLSRSHGDIKLVLKETIKKLAHSSQFSFIQ